MFILLSKSFSDVLHHECYNSTDDGEYPKSFCLIKETYIVLFLPVLNSHFSPSISLILKARSK